MTEPGELYAKFLTENLQRAVDWLKFAEAKNAALLGIASAWTLAGLNIVCSDKFIPGIIHATVLIALAFSGVAALIAMASFVPRTSRWPFNKKVSNRYPVNLLFYGDLGKFSPDDLGPALQERYLPNTEGITQEYFHDLVEQIRINSKIAADKLDSFKMGVGAMFVSGLMIVSGSFIYAGLELGALW